MRLLPLLLPLALTACPDDPETRTPAPQDSGAAGSPQVAAGPPLHEFLDDVREARGVLIAAHRGGPTDGFPENALETLQHGFEEGLRVFEVDVAESQDGVLYLMHDRSLRRTAGHDGAVADTDWEVVESLDLRDPDGDPTGFHPPKLAVTLAWAKERGAILELDRKSTTSFRNIMGEVRAAGAENHVLLITYSDEEAIQVAKIAPGMMMTAGVRNAEQRTRLEEAGVDMTRVVAWLGTRSVDADAIAYLAGVEIESAFGTLGRPGRRLDDVYAEDGDASEYQDLVDLGVTLLATDRPYFVARELTSDDLAIELLENGAASQR
ncbi:MAG: glycerophosphodiester phosphodiesterase family protein [Planctomycetota bacterium]